MQVRLKQLVGTIALCLTGAWANGQVVLKVTQLPAGTSASDTIYIAGSFNSWNPGSPAYALRKGADGTLQISLPASLGAVEYKFTRGSWDRAEVDRQNQPIPNRQADASQRQEITHHVLGWSDAGGSASVVRNHTATAQVELLQADFYMPQLSRHRRVQVYLPADYTAKAARRYPVLYLHDGQNVFDAATSFSGEWGIDEALDQLRASGQDPTGSIVVAVDNGGDQRANEYIPWVNPALKMGGQGAAYVDFMAQTLKPYVDAHYRTRPEAAHTGIAGSSLGGLISVYAALKYPQVFGQVGAFSPAFWVCQDSLLAFARQHPAARQARFYFVCGPQESETMLPLMTAWREVLRRQGVPNAQLAFRAPADGQHREWFWQREFPAAYQWLFGHASRPAASPKAKQKQSAPPK